MFDDPLDDPKDDPKENTFPPENPDKANPLETQKPQMPIMEEFPEKLGCPQCRRMFPVKSLRAKANTLLTEAALVCPRCRRKLRRMKLKDWYDHYVQGQEKDFKMDSHGFVHTDPPGMGLNAPQEDQQDSRDPRDNRNARDQRPSQGQNQGGTRDRRGGGPNRGRDPRQNQRGQQQQNRPQKKSILPQNPKAYRLPKKRRSR